MSQEQPIQAKLDVAEQQALLFREDAVIASPEAVDYSKELNKMQSSVLRKRARHTEQIRVNTNYTPGEFSAEDEGLETLQMPLSRDSQIIVSSP